MKKINMTQFKKIAKIGGIAIGGATLIATSIKLTTELIRKRRIKHAVEEMVKEVEKIEKSYLNYNLVIGVITTSDLCKSLKLKMIDMLRPCETGAYYSKFVSIVNNENMSNDCKIGCIEIINN